MPVYRDQLGDQIQLDGRPVRIVSLVPSQTQLLFDFGLDEEVAGITKFCIHPDSWFRTKQRVGGTKQVNIEKIRQLRPDLIIGNKEENEQNDIEALRKIAPVWMSDIYTLENALEMIRSLGEITARQEKAMDIITKINTAFDALKQEVERRSHRPKVLYAIWNEPLMVAGKNTFIDDILTRCGFENLVMEERYPEIDPANCSPELVLLSSEPYPFTEAHLEKFRTLFPNATVQLVDGEAFSWYGSRLAESPAYFMGL